MNEKILSISWNSSCLFKLDRLYDWNKCILSSEVPGSILSYDHDYYIKYFNQTNKRCSYCYKYLCKGIKDNCKTFQNTLNMKFDDNKNDEDLNNQIDDNDDETVSADEDINRKLEKVFESFKLC